MALLPERAAPRPLKQTRRHGNGGGGGGSSGGGMNRGSRTHGGNDGRGDGWKDALSNLSPVGRVSLAVALLWPVLYLCMSSSSGGGGASVGMSSSTVGVAGGSSRELGGGGGAGAGAMIETTDASLASEAAAAASRTSRVGVVVVGTDPDRVLKSVESVFLATEWDRVFSVVAVLDGVQSDTATSAKFDSVDRGRTPSPSSLVLSSKVSRRIRTALGADGGKGGGDGEASGGGEQQHRQSRITLKERKVKVVYSPTKKGVNASRRYGAEFLRLLQRKHEDAGIKPPEEEIVLLLLRSDATLLPDEGRGSWLDHVSSALNFGVAEGNKVANAVSMAVDYVNGPGGTVSGGLVSPRRVVRSVDGMTVGFDLTLRPHWIHPKEGEVDGGAASSPYVTTPALLGAATAIRLDVFASLPARDAELKTQFAADLELTLNLWLCGDGIDVVSTARVAVDPVVLTEEEAQITDENAARIAAAWMGTTHQAAVFEARSKNDAQQESMAQIAQEAVWARNLPANLRKKCRPFAWYAEEMNRDVYIPGVVADIDVAVDGPDLGGAAADEGGVANEEPEHEVQQAAAQPKEVFREQVQAVKDYLSETNKEIISHAKPQDIRFVDYSGGGKEHPHLGANDEHGRLGYVHDATALRRNPPPFHVSDLTSTCRDDGNFKMLTKKVAVDMTAHNAAERMGGRRDKIFCVVYTTEKNHDRIPAIRETWGQKCDGFMVASTKTDPNLGTVDIVHEGPEEYNNIWQKVRSIWSYVYHNYYDDYDWFHIGGDDLYVLVENLRLYLESDEIRSAANGGKAPPQTGQVEKIQTPLFLGRRFANSGDMKRIFISGGSGYTMNKAALKALVSSLDTCFGHMHTFSEDTMVATCFRKQGIFPFDTRDEQGSERYMPFSPQHHLTYRLPPPEAKDWYPLYTIGELKLGLDHCSSHSVAFHYIDTELMRRMHAILYGHCRSV